VNEFLPVVAFLITIFQVINLFWVSNNIFAFREWVLLLYAWNYLLSPVLTYEIYDNDVFYPMKINSNEYFSLITPGYLLFYFGTYFFKTTIFQPSFSQIREYSIPNESMLKNTVYIGIILKLLNPLVPNSIAFFVYLFSLIRFVGAFSLYNVNPKKYSYLTVLVFAVEFYSALKSAMFHDAIMWFIFFLLFYVYVKKPSIPVKIIGLTGFVMLILVIQFLKGEYRQSTWSGERKAGLKTAIELANSNSDNNSITGEDNLKGTLNRSNQAWILASTINNMDTYKDFQGLNNVIQYIEAALLPRFLAPNKITSGNQEHFNRFSGHQIGEGTSMGLGIFADGYIAYGKWGLWIFGFVLGLIFSLTFKLVEQWTKISPFYLMFLLPMLNYAARPDCETQTTINQISKSILFFGILVWLTKNRFSMKTSITSNIILRESRAIKRLIGISKTENKAEVQSQRIRKLMGRNS
jgi:hypothetical protein